MLVVSNYKFLNELNKRNWVLRDFWDRPVIRGTQVGEASSKIRFFPPLKNVLVVV